MHLPGMENGQVQIGGNTVRTARALRTYLGERAGRRPKASPKAVYPLIREKYCDMLGIDPLNMLAVSMPLVWIPILDPKIDTNFQSSPSDLPVNERIWQAHAAALEGIPKNVMQYVRVNYLSLPPLSEELE